MQRRKRKTRNDESVVKAVHTARVKIFAAYPLVDKQPKNHKIRTENCNVNVAVDENDDDEEDFFADADDDHSTPKTYNKKNKEGTTVSIKFIFFKHKGSIFGYMNAGVGSIRNCKAPFGPVQRWRNSSNDRRNTSTVFIGEVLQASDIRKQPIQSVGRFCCRGN